MLRAACLAKRFSQPPSLHVLACHNPSTLLPFERSNFELGACGEPTRWRKPTHTHPRSTAPAHTAASAYAQSRFPRAHVSTGLRASCQCKPRARLRCAPVDGG
eukprot:1591714-Pleurochrysis_carterae.AAC.1